GRRRSALTLIFRPDLRTAVWVLRRTGQSQQTELPDLHPRPQRDRRVVEVGCVERDVSSEARVDEAGRRMRQQAEPAERRLALEAAREIDGKRAPRQRRTQDDLTRMEDERLAFFGLDQAGQIVLAGRRIDMRIAGVVE